MLNETLELILRINIALAAAIVVVLALRPHVRMWFGARVGYALWVIPLFAAGMCFVPGRTQHITLEANDTPMPAFASAPAMEAQPDYLLWAWAAGAVVSLLVLALRQARFTHALGKLSAREDLGAGVHSAESTTHGPAVVGVLKPLIVTPSDFDKRFDEEERRIVLAHERAHLAQGDPWINAVVLVVQCLSWFNPFVYIGARALRIDQELACDATVLGQAEGARRRYAEAMLKTHISAAVPIGCAWPAYDVASFKERISMLKRNLPSRNQTIAGVSVIALVTAAAAAAAWAAQPARIVTTLTPAERSISAPDDRSSFELIHSEDAMDNFDHLDELDAIDDLDDPDAFAELEQLAETGRLEGQRIYIDGELVEGRDLTPAERDEVRRSVREAREAMARAREEVRVAMREAQRTAVVDYRRAEMEARIEAMQEVRDALEESRAERERALEEARAEIERIDFDRIQAEAEAAADIDEALNEARAEIAEELADAQADGDEQRVRELREAQRALSEHDSQRARRNR
jgi:beta-lactamase regulating signal transducer with metallopeptidase domain